MSDKKYNVLIENEIILLPQLTIEFSACPAAEIHRRKTLKYPHIPAVFFLVFRQRSFA